MMPLDQHLQPGNKGGGARGKKGSTNTKNAVKASLAEDCAEEQTGGVGGGSACGVDSGEGVSLLEQARVLVLEAAATAARRVSIHR